MTCLSHQQFSINYNNIQQFIYSINFIYKNFYLTEQFAKWWPFCFGLDGTKEAIEPSTAFVKSQIRTTVQFCFRALLMQHLYFTTLGRSQKSLKYQA